MRYLEFSVQDLTTKDEAIHNLLISLYIKKQPNKIIPYLTSSGAYRYYCFIDSFSFARKCHYDINEC